MQTLKYGGSIPSYLWVRIVEYDPEQCEHGVAQGVKVPRVRALRVRVSLSLGLVDHMKNARRGGSLTYDIHIDGG